MRRGDEKHDESYMCSMSHCLRALLCSAQLQRTSGACTFARCWLSQTSTRHEREERDGDEAQHLQQRSSSDRSRATASTSVRNPRASAVNACSGWASRFGFKCSELALAPPTQRCPQSSMLLENQPMVWSCSEARLTLGSERLRLLLSYEEGKKCAAWYLGKPQCLSSTTDRKKDRPPSALPRLDA